MIIGGSGHRNLQIEACNETRHVSDRRVAENLFEENPVAVYRLEKWLTDSVMQAIAAENNLPETVFLMKANGGHGIVWFSPLSEVRLCGHGTLTRAFGLFEFPGHSNDTLSFDCASGSLRITSEGDLITLDFPAQLPEPCDQLQYLQGETGV